MIVRESGATNRSGIDDLTAFGTISVPSPMTCFLITGTTQERREHQLKGRLSEQRKEVWIMRKVS